MQIIGGDLEKRKWRFADKRHFSQRSSLVETTPGPHCTHVREGRNLQQCKVRSLGLELAAEERGGGGGDMGSKGARGQTG